MKPLAYRIQKSVGIAQISYEKLFDSCRRRGYQFGGLAKLANATASKAVGFIPWRFKSSIPHQKSY